MLDATIKRLYIILVAIASVICTVSCSGKKSDDERQAEALMAKIKTLYADKNYDKAMLMIDSLMKAYPGMIDVQRRAMHIQTMITEKVTINDSINNELAFKKNALLADSVKKGLKYVKNADMVEGYFISRAMPDNGMPNTTQIIARVTEDGDLSVMSSLRGHRISHTSLKVSTDTASSSTATVPLSNSRNYRYNDNGQSVELVTFNEQECADFCAFIADNTSQHMSLSYIGKSSAYKAVLSQQEKEAFATVFAYRCAVVEMQKAMTMRLKFAKKLQLARKQIKQTATNIQGQTSNTDK